MSQKLFLYARKSTDVEDKQILSIEAQITELQEFSRREGFQLVDVFIEKQSAKMPGRPIFNEMMRRLEQGDADGIVSWHPDRLARNSVDGGKIIYLLDCGRLSHLKFPQFWFENTPQGKFMLNISFGQSKYYIDSLSENVKRGLRQKVRNGICPGLAPIGYLNDMRSRDIMVDKKKAPIIKAAFELYAQGNSRLEDVAHFLQERGIASKFNLPLKRDRISFILSNPFYVGLFRYGKELHEGKHEPLLSKQIFDQVQAVLTQKGRPHHKTKNEPQVFCGLFHCGTCGMGITGEYRTKKQKNGNVHDYIYYRCTKKNKEIVCNEPHVREEAADQQISSLLQPYSLPEDWAKELLKMLAEDQNARTQSSAVYAREAKKEVEIIKTKLQRLLDGYLAQDIEREVYVENKAGLLSNKKSLDEKIIHLEHKEMRWVEPMREWIKEAEMLTKTASGHDLLAKKVIAKKIFGSNLSLMQKVVVVKNQETSPYPSESIRKSSHITQWAAVKAAHQMVPEKPLCFVLAGAGGIEPTLTVLETVVLPLYDAPKN